MPPGHLPVSSYLAVPVVSRSGDVLGGLFFGHAEPGVFSVRAERLAMGIAAQAAIAIDNARLFRQAQRAVDARDEFLSIASHELRTPLAAIKATAQVALRASMRGELTRERSERSLQTISNSTDHVARLASDLLDVARLQAGSMPMVRTRMDITLLVKQVVNGFRDQWADQRELILELNAQNVFIEGDADRLEQVFGNLLENAAKYSPSASTVRLACAVVDHGAQVVVVDHGIGLPEGAAANLFRPFTRAANAIDRHIQGLGLGLHIARQVVEAHGGRIWCTSACDGQGSTFYVWLPLVDAPTPG